MESERGLGWKTTARKAFALDPSRDTSSMGENERPYMPQKSKPKTANFKRASAAAAAAEAGSNAAEERRMAAKKDRATAYLAESRKRDAELTAKGYCF